MVIVQTKTEIEKETNSFDQINQSQFTKNVFVIWDVNWIISHRINCETQSMDRFN